jgi:hypothetical protein
MTEITTMTRLQWMQEGERRFGKNMLKWKFVCPVCGNVQSPEDFQPYKDQGATPDSCTKACLGRYAGGRKAFGEGEGDGPCDYAAYGLFQLAPVRVIDGCDQDEPIHCFAFAEVADSEIAGPKEP